MQLNSSLFDGQDFNSFKRYVLGKKTWEWRLNDPGTQISTSWQQVNQLLGSDILSYPRIRVCSQNDFFSKGFAGFMRYGVTSSGDLIPNLHKEILSYALRSGSTLIIDRCNSYFEDICRFSDDLSGLFGCRVTANMYASFCSSSGFGLHFDDHDVIALQLEGEKEWRIHPPTHADPMPSQKSFYYQEPMDEPIHVAQLTPGQALYVPRGYWHEANSRDSNSLHVSFVINRPRKFDVVKHMISALNDDEFFRSSLPVEDDEQEFQIFRQKLIEFFTTEEIRGWVAITKSRATYREYLNVFDLPKIE